MGWVTEEQIERANTVDVLDYKIIGKIFFISTCEIPTKEINIPLGEFSITIDITGIIWNSNMNHLHKPRRFAFRFRNQKPRHIRLSVWKAAIRWLWRQLFMGCLLQTILHGILYLSAHVLGSAHVGGVLMGRGCNPGLCTEVC